MKSIAEWTVEGGAKTEPSSSIRRDLHLLQRKHTCLCMKRASHKANLGGTAGADQHLSLRGDRCFFVTHGGKGDGFMISDWWSSN